MIVSYGLHRYNSQLKVISILVLFLTACVTGQAKEPKPDTEKKSINPESSIAWLGNGAQILLNGQWLFDVQEKSFRRLNLLESSSKNNNTKFVSYPGGYSVFRYTGQGQLDVFDIKKVSGFSIKIPNWVDTDKETGEDNTIENVPVWLDDKNLYVHQFYHRSPNNFACGIYSINSTRWNKLDNNDCLESSFFYVSEINSLGSGLLAILSSAEGQQSLDFFQINYKGKKLDQKLVAKLDINAVVPTQIQRKSKNSYTVVVPCVLANNKAMECELQSTQSWSVYEWFPQSDKLQERYKMLPQAVYAALNSDDFAWIDKNKLCVGELGNKGAVCVAP